MVNMTLSIPEELIEKMRKFKEIKWSEIARQAIQKRIEALEKMNSLAKKSKLTEEDIDKISKIINKEVSKKLKLR